VTPRDYEQCREVCGNLDDPGVALDRVDQVDFSRRKTTYDQENIERAMDGMDLAGRWLLHVGVGNSAFARRFAGRAGRIDGLTVSESERAHAEALGIPNYRVYRLNKYAREFTRVIDAKYDVIVDNNLAGFACCKFHFYRMLDSYVWALKPGGRILTDQLGMDWVFMGWEPRWRLSYADLVSLEEKFPLRAARVSETVYALTKVT
jgi:hypothetical protein